MILYADPVSPNCTKVLALLDYLKLPYQLHPLSIVKRETQSSDYLKINPNGLVPTLVDGEFRLWESNAILLHLVTKVGSDLFPQDSLGRADTMRWMFWQASHWAPALTTITFERLAPAAFPGYQTDEAAVTRAQRELSQLAPVLDAHLKGRDFVVGQSLTVADFALVASASKRDLVGIDLSGYANLSRYLERIESLAFRPQTAEVG
ncbi:glutathione S-transferase family protein [bacterium]|nr:glutathione S-transferase family protein [bacterium]